MPVLLATLMAVSAALFSWRLRFVVEKIARSKKDPTFTVGHLSARVLRLAGEVFLQTKVIRERPAAGVAHALVFWAFCAFSLVTVNHFATGFGRPFMRYHTASGAVYFWLAFVFALLCAGAIAGLAFRRFVLRPRWLEPLSYESGIIAALIFILMVTFLPEWWVKEGSATFDTLWWLHTAAILMFLPMIPHTKHLHLLLSPLTVFLKYEEFSHLPPLSGDDDFGIVTGKDITRITALQAFSCVECGRCTEHCPASNTGKELNPKLIALGVREYLKEYGPSNEKEILSATISQTAVFQCTTCGACEYQCPVGIQHLPMILGLRRGAVNTGEWDDEYGNKLFHNLERSGNALGFGQSERDKFIVKQRLPIFDGTQEYCLWLGCMGAYDGRAREIIAAFASVMNHLGVTFGVLKKERCTGDPVRRLGNDLLFAQLAEQNLLQLTQASVKKIVTICPHCVRTIAQDWEKQGVAVTIEHHSEFMARFADSIPDTSDGGNVVYHDPCYLGRYRGTYNEPRSIAAKSGTVIDPPRARERSFCCGAGGGLVFLGEESGDRVNRVRTQELVATGAQTIATACPFCQSMFRDALGTATADHQPALLDIAQIAAAQFGTQVEPVRPS